MASWSSLLQAQDAALHELQSKAAAGPGSAARNVVLWRPEQASTLPIERTRVRGRLGTLA